MKIYVITDTHFGHHKLTEWGRPADFGGLMLKNLSRVHGDLLIHCGDFCVGDDEIHLEDFMRAAGAFKKKVLVRGNHDKKSDIYYLSHGFDFVCESFTATYFGKKILFSHEPQFKLSQPLVDFNVHGHLHGNSHRITDEVASAYNLHFNKDIAPDIHDYKPLDLQVLLSQQRYKQI